MFNETATAPPPGSTWPNEPAGFTVLTDEPFNALVENGWNQTFNSSMSIVTDTSGPISPPNVIQWFYPTGFVAGSAPGTEYYSFGVSGIREHYTGFWWKVSNPWQGHSSGVNKVLFSTLITQSNLFFFMLQGQSPPYHTQINTDYASPRNLPANVNNVGVTLGVWHQVEIYQKHSTTPTSADGIVRWWLDNTLVGNYTDVNFPNEDSQGDKFSPTWGGVGGSKTEGDYYWVDHVHISRP